MLPAVSTSSPSCHARFTSARPFPRLPARPPLSNVVSSSPVAASSATIGPSGSTYVNTRPSASTIGRVLYGSTCVGFAHSSTPLCASRQTSQVLCSPLPCAGACHSYTARPSPSR